MTKRYAIADFLSPDMVEAVVRIGKDKWEPRTPDGDVGVEGQGTFMRVKRNYGSDEDAYLFYCPLGLYLDVLAGAMQYEELDIEDTAVLPEGADFFAHLMEIKYGDVESMTEEDTLKERPVDLIAAADEFMDDWDASMIPPGDLGVALGLPA